MANISAIQVGGTSYGISGIAKAHASESTIYGLGTTNAYGHVKLSDTYTEPAGTAASGIAASATAVYHVWNDLNTTKCSIRVVNCPGIVDGTPTTTTIARSVKKGILSFDSPYAGYGIYIITSSTTINKISSSSAASVVPTLSSGTLSITNDYGAMNAMLIS